MYTSTAGTIWEAFKVFTVVISLVTIMKLDAIRPTKLLVRDLRSPKRLLVKIKRQLKIIISTKDAYVKRHLGGYSEIIGNLTKRDEAIENLHRLKGGKYSRLLTFKFYNCILQNPCAFDISLCKNNLLSIFRKC